MIFSSNHTSTPMPSRLTGYFYAKKWAYRYSFNGQERDDEIAGVGNIMTAEFWEYDTRLGRRWNLDPVSFISISSFACLKNNPIIFIDPQGNYSKFGAAWRNMVHGGEGLTKSGKEWGYLKKGEGIHAVFGNNRGSNANNLREIFKASLVNHSNDVTLTGSIIEEIKNDPDFQAEEALLKQKAIQKGLNSGKLGKEAYDFLPAEPLSIEFGGKRGSFDPRESTFYSKTLPVTANSLTWALRHATIYTYVQVQADGAMNIHYTIEDKFDLSWSSGRSLGYNVISHVLGCIYHGVLLGTAPDIHGNFETNVNKDDK